MNKNQPWDILRFTGSQTWNGKTNHTTTDVADGDHVGRDPAVKFTLAATHYISVGSMITINGTKNYDGTHQCVAGTASALIYIPHRYVAEDLDNNTTFKLTLAPKQSFEFGGFKLKLNTAVSTAGDLTITVDAGHAATVYDYQLYKQAMDTIQYLNWNIQDEPESFEKDDELTFAWANADNLTYGLEVYWRRR